MGYVWIKVEVSHAVTDPVLGQSRICGCNGIKDTIAIDFTGKASPVPDVTWQASAFGLRDDCTASSEDSSTIDAAG